MTFLRVHKVAAGSHVFLTGRAASSSCSPPFVVGAAAITRIRLVAGAAAVPARRMQLFSIAMESLASSAADGGDGVARNRDIWHEESPSCAGTRRRARLQAVRGLTNITTGFKSFAVCLRHTTKCLKHTVNTLPYTAHGKDRMAQ